MRRLIVLLLMSLFALHASGVDQLIAELACEEKCPDDDAKKCAPGCDNCLCCTRLGSAPFLAPVPPAPVDAAPLEFMTSWGEPASPSTTDPSALDHVPKRLA